MALTSLPLHGMQFVHKALELTSALSLDIFEMQPCTTLYFLLGPSALRPVEIYALSCSATAHVAAEPDDRCAEVARDISRKVLRSLIINTAAVPEGKASAGKIPTLHIQYHPYLHLVGMHVPLAQVFLSPSCACMRIS